MTTWAKELKSACDKTGDDYVKVLQECTLTFEELSEEFDDGYGSSCGKPFTAWGEKYVYFPVVYDGAEWVGYAPRNPCDIATNHQGGQ